MKTIPALTKLILPSVIAALCLGSVGACAQNSARDPQIGSGPVPVPEPASSGLAAGALDRRPAAVSASDSANHASMGMGDDVFAHLLFNQLEGRTNGPDNELRWDVEAWIGTDMNKLWFKSEGFVENGKASDGITEALYDRPLPFLRYFDAQVGVRYDLDSNPGLLWGAIGIEGLAPNFFEFEPTFYFSDRGRVAGRVNGSYDLLITNRLILQPQFELNFYNKSDPSREIGSGLSELDTGLRLRYEISRKFAPYIGVAYAGKFGETADLTRAEDGIVNDVRFVFGIRVWY
jgi:copper resistance protein B